MENYSIRIPIAQSALYPLIIISPNVCRVVSESAANATSSDDRIWPNNKLAMIWKEVVVAKLRQFSGISLEVILAPPYCYTCRLRKQAEREREG
jgi:hypothetical protein